jgi:hypothetical protein
MGYLLLICEREKPSAHMGKASYLLAPASVRSDRATEPFPALLTSNHQASHLRHATRPSGDVGSIT